MRWILRTSLILAILGGFFLGTAGAVSSGDKAPDFQLQTLKGEEVALDDYLDQQPLLLVFWTTWCPYCEKEIPEIESLNSEYGSNGLAVLGVNTSWNDSRARAVSFVEKHQPNYPMAYDEGGEVSKQFSIRGVPTLVLIDREGKVQHQGYRVTEELKQSIQELL
jgi:peroxiredoxin